MTTTTADRVPATAKPSGGGSSWTGIGRLIRFALRRDRIRIPIWVVIVVGCTAYFGVLFGDLYPTAADRQAIAQTMQSPAGLAMTGPQHYLDDYTIGSILGHQMLGFTAVVVAIMSVLMVIRHTRAEEEAGRAELIRSNAVGRHASLLAAMTVAVIANIAIGVLMALGLAASGIEGLTWSGSVLYGLSHTAVGIAFAAVAAFAAQITAHSRSSASIGMAAVGVAYVLRASGDVSENGLSWVSPIGWVQRTYPFLDNRWWPLLLTIGFAAVLTWLATVLSTRRDVGAGLRATRPGRRAASGMLRRPAGFALRLHRGLLIGFAIAMLLLGAMYGSFMADVEKMVQNMGDAIVEALTRSGATMAESFTSMVLVIIAVAAAIFAVLAVLRARTEESAGRAEPVLATGLSRARWCFGHVGVALFGGAVMMLCAAVGLGAMGASTLSDSGYFWSVLGAGLSYIPAVWVFVGVAVALYGWIPRAAPLTWLLVVYAFIVGYLGRVLQAPDWLSNLDPIGHVPDLAADMRWAPIIILTLVAAGLVTVGLAGLRRRDLQTK